MSMTLTDAMPTPSGTLAALADALNTLLRDHPDLAASTVVNEFGDRVRIARVYDVTYENTGGRETIIELGTTPTA
jgi:hypothetical protein